MWRRTSTCRRVFRRPPASVPLKDGISPVLAGLTVEDSRQVYQAIGLANPGGMGKVDAADVTEIPAFSLVEEEAEKSEGDEQKKQSPELLTIKDAVVLLNPGDVTEFVPSGPDGLIAILEKREPLGDSSAGEKKAAFE